MGVSAALAAAENNLDIKDSDSKYQHTLVTENEVKVKDTFKYMMEYQLSDDELKNYGQLSELTDQMNNVVKNYELYGSDEEMAVAYNELISQYYEKLKASIHLQDENSMVPAGKYACAYRSLQIGAELFSGRPMPMSMINAATKDLVKSKALENNSYIVNRGYEIVDDAFIRLGRPDLYSSYSKTRRTVGTFYKSTGVSITGYEFHHNVYDSNDNFLFDPKTGIINRNKSRVDRQTFNINQRIRSE